MAIERDAAVERNRSVAPWRLNIMRFGVTIIAVGLFIAHQHWPQVKLDEIEIVLVIIAMLPWFIEYITGLELSGMPLKSAEIRLFLFLGAVAALTSLGITTSCAKICLPARTFGSHGWGGPRDDRLSARGNELPLSRTTTEKRE
jgi:hypothetical protein